MVQIRNGEGPQVVPLAYYDERGERHIVGQAAVEIKDGEIIALGHLDHGSLIFDGIGLEAFSVSSIPEPSPLEEAARRLGPLSVQHKEYITDTNPNGELRPCHRKDLHGPHEWWDDPKTFFDVHCPGLNIEPRRGE